MCEKIDSGLGMLYGLFFWRDQIFLASVLGTVVGQERREDDDATDRMYRMYSLLHDLTRSAIIQWIEGIQL
jgi:hypothetical protein